MSNYIISTDTASDLPKEFLQEHSIPCVSLFYVIDDVSYGGKNEMEPKDFYNVMREGKMPTTNAVNPEDYKELIRPYLEKGLDVFHIAFSSGLSSSYQNSVIAAHDLQEEFPDRRILVFDSLAASLGQGLVVYKALQKKEEGLSMDELMAWLNEMRLHFCHRFTVNDLFHLHRGGRVSKTTAIVGSLANIKPILTVDENGHLSACGKAMGRKKALNQLVEQMSEAMGSFENDTVFISHSDCLEDAQYVSDIIMSRFQIPTKIIHMISPTIGSHTGIGTVALFFMGEKR